MAKWTTASRLLHERKLYEGQQTTTEAAYQAQKCSNHKNCQTMVGFDRYLPYGSFGKLMQDKSHAGWQDDKGRFWCTACWPNRGKLKEDHDVRAAERSAEQQTPGMPKNRSRDIDWAGPAKMCPGCRYSFEGLTAGAVHAHMVAHGTHSYEYKSYYGTLDADKPSEETYEAQQTQADRINKQRQEIDKLQDKVRKQPSKTNDMRQRIVAHQKRIVKIQNERLEKETTLSAADNMVLHMVANEFKRRMGNCPDAQTMIDDLAKKYVDGQAENPKSVRIALAKLVGESLLAESTVLIESGILDGKEGQWRMVNRCRMFFPKDGSRPRGPDRLVNLLWKAQPPVAAEAWAMATEITCPDCAGSGFEQVVPPVKCKKCKGTGNIEEEEEKQMSQELPQPVVEGERCHICQHPKTRSSTHCPSCGVEHRDTRRAPPISSNRPKTQPAAFRRECLESVQKSLSPLEEYNFKMTQAGVYASAPSTQDDDAGPVPVPTVGFDLRKSVPTADQVNVKAKELNFRNLTQAEIDYIVGLLNMGEQTISIHKTTGVAFPLVNHVAVIVGMEDAVTTPKDISGVEGGGAYGTSPSKNDYDNFMGASNF